MIVNETCGGTTKKKNTGRKKQCTAKPVVDGHIFDESFQFESVAASKELVNWNAGKAAKKIIPLYKVENLELNNTEQKTYEGRFETITLKDSVKGVKYNMLVSSCSYDALKSVIASGAQRIVRTCSDGTFHCEIMDDGTVKGEPLFSATLGAFNETTDEKPENADLTLKFKDYERSSLKPNFDLEEFEGIYDVELSQPLDANGDVIPSTAVLLKVGVYAGCAGNKPVETLEDGDLIVKDGSGAVQSVTFVGYDSVNGLYELSGTGFTNGFTVELNGVVAQTAVMYEAVNVLTIAGI